MGWLTWSQDCKKNNAEIKEWVRSVYRKDSILDISVKSKVIYVLRYDYRVDVLLYINSKNEFGYKGMCELEHPYYYDCPLKFIQKEGAGNKEWRDCVREYHSNNKLPKMKIGDKLVFEDNYPYYGDFPVTEFTVIDAKKLLFNCKYGKAKLPRKIAIQGKIIKEDINK